jgi:hypothetical protein
METASCLGFNIECGVLLKGAGVTIAGFILFVGSVYVLLSAIFGRWMGYLVLMIAFSGWMIIQSSLWLFGFWSQGPETPTNLGPRGADAAWTVLEAGLEPSGNGRFAEFDSFPRAPWFTPSESDPAMAADYQSSGGAATTFLAEEANHELGIEESDLAAIPPTQFIVDTIAFAPAADGTKLAVIEAHYAGGGPRTVLSLYFDGGDVPKYSYMFLAGSVLLFAVHLPLLDRAERKRRQFLTGGGAPPWFGPN